MKDANRTEGCLLMVIVTIGAVALFLLLFPYVFKSWKFWG